ITAIFALMLSRLNSLWLPFTLQRRNAILHEQFVALLPIIWQRTQVRSQLARHWSLDVDLLGRVEEGVQLVELLLADRVVFMVVALGTPDSQAEPDRAYCTGAIHRLLNAKLFTINATLAVGQRIAMESGCGLLLGCGARKQVTRDL